MAKTGAHKVEIYLLLLAVALIFPVSKLQAQNSATVVRVNDITGAPISNLILVLLPGHPVESVAAITDSSGSATFSSVHCAVCVLTVVDPRGLFPNKTIDFDNKRSQIALTLQVKGVIDTIEIGTTHDLVLELRNAEGQNLSLQQVVVRKDPISIEEIASFGAWRGTTDNSGTVSGTFLPGERYVVAAMVKGNLLEASFSGPPSKQTNRGDTSGTTKKHLTLTLLPTTKP